MRIIKSYRLAQDYTIVIGDPWTTSPSITDRVDQIWTLEKAQRGDQLTNGQVYALAELHPDYIRIQPSEYKYVLSQRRAPTLALEGLNIRPLAVTGILICADGLVLGRRGSTVADDVGLWEPAPAGGLSVPNPQEQLFEELEEELGISKTDVGSVKTCGLVEDVETKVLDIVFRLETAASAQEIQAAYTNHGSDEYADLTVIEISKVATFLEDHRNNLLPALQTMLRLASVI